MHRHFPVNCFVPPHILKNIATKGTPGQKNLAIDTLKLSAQMRGQRQALADFQAATFRVAVAGKDRIVYDAKNGSNLPGTVVRKEGDGPSGDVAVNEAYDGSGVTYDLYNAVYQRNPLMEWHAPTHGSLPTGDDNAFGMASRWSMVMAMRICRQRASLQPLHHCAGYHRHELTHGVTQFEAKLQFSTAAR
jgi:Zn-dependent metalloprotease